MRSVRISTRLILFAARHQVFMNTIEIISVDGKDFYEICINLFAILAESTILRLHADFTPSKIAKYLSMDRHY